MRTFSLRWLLLALAVVCPCGVSIVAGLQAAQAPAAPAASPAGIPRTAVG